MIPPQVVIPAGLSESCDSPDSWCSKAASGILKTGISVLRSAAGHRRSPSSTEPDPPTIHGSDGPSDTLRLAGYDPWPGSAWTRAPDEPDLRYERRRGAVRRLEGSRRATVPEVGVHPCGSRSMDELDQEIPLTGIGVWGIETDRYPLRRICGECERVRVQDAGPRSGYPVAVCWRTQGVIRAQTHEDTCIPGHTGRAPDRCPSQADGFDLHRPTYLRF